MWGDFLAERIDAPGAEARLRSSYADRGERFLKLIERELQESAYARLLHHAGIAPADVAYSENGMLDLLHGLGLSWQKTRPVHPQADPKAQAAFKKSSRR